jgi:hypothetical protein
MSWYSPPLHWNCRCTVIVETKTYAELGAPELDEPLEGKRASSAGPVSDKTDFAAFLKRQPDSFVEDVLGKKRAEMYLNGKIGLDDLINGNGRMLTLAELNAKYVGTKQVFVEQSTTAGVSKWLMDNNLVDYADFSGVDVSIANEISESIARHLDEFPELRKNQRFAGTSQDQLLRWKELASQEDRLLLINHGGFSPEEIKALIDKKYVIPEIQENTLMQSMSDIHVSGISVNLKWADDASLVKKNLKLNVDYKTHPIGCDSMKAMADHEMGHQLDDLLGVSGNIEIQKLYAKAQVIGVADNLSVYAGTNLDEFIAEAWSEALNNPSPRYYAAAVARIIKNEYQRQFPK